MYVLEDLDLIPAPVDIEPVFISNESVIGPGLRYHMHVLCGLPYFEPLLLLHFVLEQIIEVSSALARIPSKEVEGFPI